MKKYNAKYYDQIYEAGGNFQAYKNHYKESPYFGIWQLIINSWLSSGYILDMGCGPGQFAQMVSEMKPEEFIKYTGIDFSNKAIIMAKQKKLPSNFNFYTYTFDWWIRRRLFYQFDTYILLETLEHLEQELEFDILTAIPSGKTVIISLPDFDSPGHLRVYPDFDFIRLRYEYLFIFKEFITRVVNINTGASITAFRAIKI